MPTNKQVQEPGAKANAGTGKRQVRAARDTFRRSVGHGSPGGGNGQEDGTGGTGDPTITYRVNTGWAKPLGRTGKFGTQDQMGKMPLNYDEDLSSYLLEY